MKRWGIWTQGGLNQLRYNVQGYYRAYYTEIRKIVSEQDPDFEVAPHWFKGGRRIQTTACADGVCIVHRPFDEDSFTFPEGKDEFSFYLQHHRPVKELVADFVPEREGGDFQINLLDYPIGQRFGVVSYGEPIQVRHPVSAESDIIEELKWTRLDAVDMDNLDIWKDKSRARREAREVLSTYLDT